MHGSLWRNVGPTGSILTSDMGPTGTHPDRGSMVAISEPLSFGLDLQFLTTCKIDTTFTHLYCAHDSVMETKWIWMVPRTGPVLKRLGRLRMPIPVTFRY